MKGENGTPETPEWELPKRCDKPCARCITTTDQELIWIEGTDAHLVRGEN